MTEEEFELVIGASQKEAAMPPHEQPTTQGMMTLHSEESNDAKK
jgi:hypothetical protein